MFIVGVMIYARATQARDRAGRYGLWALTAFLVVIYLASSISPPPPSVSALAWTALIGWPLTLFPWWVDRHRMPRSVSSPERFPE
jgi:RsiW-degrading membrane proteinase PrsW (M82 family)